MLKDGDFSHVELMMGTNQDEGNFGTHERLFRFPPWTKDL
jgi:hypothetical protein